MQAIAEHPLLMDALESSDDPECVFEAPTSAARQKLSALAIRLAKAGVQLGGAGAATLLHQYLTDGAETRLRGHEVIVIHGLTVDSRIDLGGGAYLAAYESVGELSGLPDDPDAWLATSPLDPGRWNRSKGVAALVRPIFWGPGVIHPQDKRHRPRVRFTFPADCATECGGWLFRNRHTLVSLLSIAVGAKLVSHSAFIAFPAWMSKLEPNLRTANSGGSRGGPFDVWPKDQPISVEEAQVFADLARGWVAFPTTSSIELAVHRTAAALGPAAGPFGREDRILDAAIALEIIYDVPRGKITRKLRNRAARLLRRPRVAEEVDSFYGVRSRIVHGDAPPSGKALGSAMARGRELARASLLALLERGHPVADWGTV